MAFPVAAVLGGVSAGLSGMGGMQANQANIQGAKTALKTQRMGQALADKIFQASIARERPFIEAGQAALPLSVLAAGAGGGNYADTAAYRYRDEAGRAALADLLGGANLSPFAGKRFGDTLNLSEEANNRARLADLIAIGLGSSGTAGQESMARANANTAAALQQGALAGATAQNIFEAKQNMVNQLLGSLSGLPSYYAAQGSGTVAGPYRGSRMDTTPSSTGKTNIYFDDPRYMYAAEY